MEAKSFLRFLTETLLELGAHLSTSGSAGTESCSPTSSLRSSAGNQVGPGGEHLAELDEGGPGDR